MKRIVGSLLCLLLVFCTSCHRSYPPVLLEADRLASVRPSRAVQLLDSIRGEMGQASEVHRMYYALLCVKAWDKDYRTHTSDSLIQSVLRYYVRRDERRHLPEAYYYAGRVASDLGDALQAQDYFEKALDTQPAGEVSVLRSKILSQLGTLFAYQDMYYEAAERYRQSYQCDSILQDSLGMIFNLRDLGNMYRELDAPDSTLFLFKQAHQLALSIGRTDFVRMMQGQLASIYMDCQQYDSAHIALSRTLQEIEKPSRSGIYSIAARYYEAIGREDSALWYYDRLLECGTVHAKRRTYRKLYERALTRKEYADFTRYERLYRIYNDSVERLTQTESIRRANALYNYRLREKENHRLEAENRSRLLYLYIIIGVWLSGVSAFVVYYCRNRVKRQLLQHRLRQIEQDKQEREQAWNALSEKISTLRKLQEKNVQIPTGELLRQTERYNYLIECLEQQDTNQEKQKLLFESAIYQTLRREAHTPTGVARVTEEDWRELKLLLEKSYSRFFGILYWTVPTLKPKELRLCMLLKMAFSPAEISRLLDVDMKNVTAIRTRLYTKMTGTKGKPADLDAFVIPPRYFVDNFVDIFPLSLLHIL